MAEAPKREPRQRPSRRKTAEQRVRATSFPVVMRGYDRNVVDRYVSDVIQIVAELEATQLRENVVQRALDEVGEQTSGILQRAHETAEEIESRSRSQAEGRLQRAEREAEAARRDAERYAEELAAETQRLWEERLRMIEDMRQLADEVLGVADDALERLPEPDALLGDAAEPFPEGIIPSEAPADPTLASAAVPIPDDPLDAEDPTLRSEPDGDPDDSTAEFASPAEPQPQEPQPRDQGAG